MPTCPHCKKELEYLDFIDNSYDGSQHESIWKGNCSVCGKVFTWTEIYLFDRIENLQEKVEGN